ncbi:MAG TPA: hypothetical protein VMW01_17575 [Williamwhitmania sp.]|nr:hypothetical protein [Williamwhitmania sp.]
MEKINYPDLEQFNGLYLEDSFVLQIIETSELVSFHMEFVLTKDHPEYQKPLVNEMYCYRYGVINFIEPKQVLWKYRNQKAISIDANGENDFGNIDVFSKFEDNYLLEGDWGNVLISCKNIEVKL